MKLLVLLLVALFAAWLWRSRHSDDGQGRAAHKNPRRASATPGRRRLAAPQPMVRCAVCGLHLPRQDALSAHGTHYCGQPHFEEASAGGPSAQPTGGR
ncbi:MAG: PP0621 family protein [Comamonas sp.]